MNSRDFKFYGAFFALVMITAVVFRMPFMSVDRVWPDEALYAWNAQRIFQDPSVIFSKEIIDFHPPLFSILLSLGNFFGPPFEACHQIVFWINVFGIAFMYWLGARGGRPFAGCLAALLLGFNPLYFEMSSTILIDGVLTVFTMICFLVLLQNTNRKIGAGDFLLGLLLIALILLKWSAGLFLPVICFYYWFTFKDWPLKDRCRKIAPALLAAGAVIIGLLILNKNIHGSWVPKVFHTDYDYYRQPFYFYFKNMSGNVFGVYWIPLFLAGLWMAFKDVRRDLWIHGVWVVLTLAVISLMSSKDLRFLLPIIPSIFLVTGSATEKMLDAAEARTGFHLLKPFVLILVFFVVIFHEYPRLEKSMQVKAFSYVGFQEAGEILRKEMAQHPNAVIYATSPRMIRYFSGTNYEEFGGTLRKLPDEWDLFRQQIATTKQDSYLVVDEWEWTQPKWACPLDEPNNVRLAQLGFQLEQTVLKDKLNKDGSFTKEITIWIFHRQAGE